jgi:hypothetical protein
MPEFNRPRAWKEKVKEARKNELETVGILFLDRRDHIVHRVCIVASFYNYAKGRHTTRNSRNYRRNVDLLLNHPRDPGRADCALYLPKNQTVMKELENFKGEDSSATSTAARKGINTI